MSINPRHLAAETPRTAVVEHIQEILSKYYGPARGTGRRRGYIKDAS